MRSPHLKTWGSEGHCLLMPCSRMAVQPRTRTPIPCLLLIFPRGWPDHRGHRDETRSTPHHTSVPGAVPVAGWLHSALSQTVASVPNSDGVCRDLLWKSKPGDCRLYLKSRPCSTAQGEWPGSRRSGVCLARPVGHQHPPGPAQHGRCTRLPARQIWEDNKLHRGADDPGGLFAVCTVYIQAFGDRAAGCTMIALGKCYPGDAEVRQIWARAGTAW